MTTMGNSMPEPNPDNWDEDEEPEYCDWDGDDPDNWDEDEEPEYCDWDGDDWHDDIQCPDCKGEMKEADFNAYGKCRKCEEYPHEEDAEVLDETDDTGHGTG